jgi:uncharacterized RDD family membrane protein YckC
MKEEHYGPRAGAVTRFGAFFVDAIIIAFGLRSTGWLLRGTTRMLGKFAPPADLDAILIAIAPLLVAAYLVGFWTVLGQTPGKWLMGIKIVPLEGGRLKLRRALIRVVGYLVAALPFYAGYLWILGPERRGWHDHMARTEVRYVRRREAPTTSITAAEVRRRISSERPSYFLPGRAPRRLPSRPAG